MDPAQQRELALLKFEGPRFQDHGLDVSVLGEIVAYRELVVETAKELWRSRNPARARLPSGFGQDLVVKFFELKDGSTMIPLLRQFSETLYPTTLPDVFDDAADLLDDAIQAAFVDGLPPSSMPVSVVRKLAQFGTSLSEAETVAIKSSRHSAMAVYDASARARVSKWVEPTYSDEVEYVGEIRSADLDGSKFAIRIDSGQKIVGIFSADQERMFVDGLAQHDTRLLRLKGLAEFYRIDGKPKRIIRVDSVEFVVPANSGSDELESPLWQRLAKISASVPALDWEVVPEDMAEDPDKYLAH